MGIALGGRALGVLIGRQWYGDSTRWSGDIAVLIGGNVMGIALGGLALGVLIGTRQCNGDSTRWSGARSAHRYS